MAKPQSLVIWRGLDSCPSPHSMHVSFGLSALPARADNMGGGSDLGFRAETGKQGGSGVCDLELACGQLCAPQRSGRTSPSWWMPQPRTAAGAACKTGPAGDVGTVEHWVVFLDKKTFQHFSQDKQCRRRLTGLWTVLNFSAIYLLLLFCAVFGLCYAAVHCQNTLHPYDIVMMESLECQARPESSVAFTGTSCPLRRSTVNVRATPCGSSNIPIWAAPIPPPLLLE